jgi:hypothetical protein
MVKVYLGIGNTAHQGLRVIECIDEGLTVYFIQWHNLITACSNISGVKLMSFSSGGRVGITSLETTSQLVDLLVILARLPV